MLRAGHSFRCWKTAIVFWEPLCSKVFSNSEEHHLKVPLGNAFDNTQKRFSHTGLDRCKEPWVLRAWSYTANAAILAWSTLSQPSCNGERFGT